MTGERDNKTNKLNWGGSRHAQLESERSIHSTIASWARMGSARAYGRHGCIIGLNLRSTLTNQELAICENVLNEVLS